MADKKKVFTIQINGLKEAVDMAKNLEAELESLSQSIDKLDGRKIKITGEVDYNLNEQKTVVSGGSTSDTSNKTREERIEAEKLLAIKKQITAEEKTQGQLLATQADEYREAYISQQQVKQEIKEAKDELNAMASGAAKLTSEGLQYTNTMKGMKAELKALKVERDQLDLAKPEEVERFKQIQERALELETLLKSIESEAGVFSRNVGNYPQLLKQATTEWENVQKIIVSLSDKLAKATPGTEGYDKLKSELEQAEKYAKVLDERLGDIKSNIDEVNATGIKIDVGGKEREFNSLKDAVKTLTQELQQMTLAGEEGSKEFEVTIEALGRVKTAIAQTSGEIQSYVGGAKALNDTIEIMQGLSGLASIGVGLQGLFGGVNEETDEALRKFAQLSLVMQGLANEQKALQDGTSIWGETLRTTWNWLDKIGKYTGLNTLIGLFSKAKKTTGDWVDQLSAAAKFKDFNNLADNIKSVSGKMSVQMDATSSDKLKQQLSEMTESLSKVAIIRFKYEADQKGLDTVKQNFDKMRQDIFKDIQELNQEKIDIQLAGGSQEDLDAIDEKIQHLNDLLDGIDGTEIEVEFGDTKQMMDDIELSVKNVDESLKNLDKNDPDAEKYRELAEEFKNVANEVLNAQKSTTSFAGTLGKIPVVGKLAAVAMNGVSVALKGVAVAIKTVAKATIILAVVQAAFEVLEPVIEAVGNAAKWVFGLFGQGVDAVRSWFGVVGAGANQTKESLDSLNTVLDMTRDRLSKYNKEVDRMKAAGAITQVDAFNLKLQQLQKELQQAGADFNKFIDSVDNLDKPLKDNLNAIGSWYESFKNSDSVDDFVKRWNTLRKAVEAGTDEIKQETGSGSWWYTASDAVDDFTDANKAMLQDLSNQIKKIDFSNPEKAIKDFDKLFQGEIGNARDYAARNIDKLFPEEPWAQMLKARLDATREFLDQYRDMMAESGNLTAQLHKDAAKQIRDNTTAALPERQREIQQLKDQRADELAEMKKQGYAVEDERKLEASINAKYDRMESDRRKARLKSISKSGDDEYNILKQIRDNLLSLQAEGLDKEIKKLENAMADELHAAEKATKHRGELIASIQKKYQKLIEDKRTEWYKKLKKQQEAWNKEWAKMMADSAAELAEINNTAALNSINRNLDQAENTNIKRTANISYDTSIDTSSMSFEENDKNLQAQKKYYEDMLKAQSEYIAEKTKLQLEESQENERILREQAEREYNQRLSQTKEWYETQIEQQNEAVKRGEVTEEEYQKNLLSITNSYQQANADDYEAYQTKLNEATKNGEQERNNIISQGRQEQQQTNDAANQKAIQAIQEYYNEIADIAEREQTKNMNRHTGLFNYAKEKERLEKVKQSYDEMMKDLEQMYEKLKQQLNDGEIDFDQFNQGKKQIEELKKQAKKAADETGNSISDLFQTWANSVNDYAQKIGQQIQSMWNTFNEIQNLKLEAEQAALDREQEMLDKEKDMVEKAYDKQADIVQRYKDSINDTEDELKSARGERRLALLDGLAQQREGYLAETDALKKQQNEKEKIAKKEEQLKKKQEQLEKKRKQQQQKASIVNAIINTALGVTQALASWPPPASYALAAAVGALGAVEIALISSQKYAKGGLIEGPDHAHGGVKIQTSKGIAEVEGKEFITNKTTTTQNLQLMEFVNSKKRRLNLDDFIEFYSGKAKYKKAGSSLKFADGGTMPELTDFSDYNVSQPVVVDLTIDSKVSTVDIINSIDRVTQTRVLAGL